MKVNEILTEGLSHDNVSKIVDKFIKFTANHLNLDSLPKIHLSTDPKVSVDNHSFGGYSPSSKSIHISISNRHIQDVLRTLAHEIAHFKQDLNGELDSTSGDDGSPQENEANAVAAVVMRKWGKMHPNLFAQGPID